VSFELKSLRPLGRLAIASLLVPALPAAAPGPRPASGVRAADVTSAPSAELLEELKQWKLDSLVSTTRLLPKANFESALERNYTLKNKIVRKFLHHEVQTFGVNLGFTDNASLETGKKAARWFFTRNGRADGLCSTARSWRWRSARTLRSSVTRSGNPASTSPAALDRSSSGA
jgi:hypothetical protein